MENVFSPAEKEILKILGRRKMTITEITKNYFGQYPFNTPRPIEPNNYIGAALRRIKKKCDAHEMKWTIDGKGAGTKGRTVWRSKRQ